MIPDKELAKETAEKMLGTLTFGAVRKLGCSQEEWQQEAQDIILSALTKAKEQNEDAEHHPDTKRMDWLNEMSWDELYAFAERADASDIRAAIDSAMNKQEEGKK